MKEEWKDIKDYEGLYQVSNWGRILSLNYHREGKAELKNPSEDKDGYLKVNLWKNGKYKTCKVHRLVAETFLPNPENKPCINHKIEGDEGKKINMVIFNEDGSINKEKTSIEWVTREENNNYGSHNERSAKARSKPVLQFSLTGEFIREWPSAMEASHQIGIAQPNICNCCRGKLKSTGGFVWRYATNANKNM